jgi:hypothetical protein
LVKDNWTGHNLAPAIGEKGLGRFEIVHLEGNVVPAGVAVARWLRIPINRPIILKQFKHEIWPDADHGD